MPSQSGVNRPLFAAYSRCFDRSCASALLCGGNASGIFKICHTEYCSLGLIPVPREFVWSKQITYYIILPTWVSIPLIRYLIFRTERNKKGFERLKKNLRCMYKVHCQATTVTPCHLVFAKWKFKHLLYVVILTSSVRCQPATLHCL